MATVLWWLTERAYPTDCPVVYCRWFSNALATKTGGKAESQMALDFLFVSNGAFLISRVLSLYAVWHTTITI